MKDSQHLGNPSNNGSDLLIMISLIMVLLYIDHTGSVSVDSILSDGLNNGHIDEHLMTHNPPDPVLIMNTDYAALR